MGYQTIEVHNSTPHIGAEIRGVDLSSPLGNQQFQEVHDALMDRLVIFFHDQKLSIEQHKDFGRRFGNLHVHPKSPDLVPDHPDVLVIKADDKAKYIAGEDWHSDVSSRAADGLDPLSDRSASRRRWRHHVRQHVSRLRNAVAADPQADRWAHSGARWREALSWPLR